MRIKIVLLIALSVLNFPAKTQEVLKPELFKHYIDRFNSMESETIVQAIPNSKSWQWLQQNIPFFQCPDSAFEEIYYFRWWTFRKHLKQTPQGFVFTEFLVPRSYADKYNLISSALGHHIYEARWLHNQEYLNDYINIWYRGDNGKPLKKLRAYSSWSIDAIWSRYLVNRDSGFVRGYLEDLVRDYAGWESEKKYPGGLFWQYDVRDAMEETISGGRREKNPRPSINGYMYGNAMALSKMAGLLGQRDRHQLYLKKADSLKQAVAQQLWDRKTEFFQVRKEPADTLAAVMEEIGFIPWYFNLPDAKYSSAWRRLMDPQHFNAPAGITTADRNHPAFRTHGCCKCEWDGAVWPFATAQTLTALANLLNHYTQPYVTKSDYFLQLKKYAGSQHREGKPYIGEYMDEKTGQWLTADERGRYYNHSTFNDLVITGLAGLRPRPDDVIEVNPLLPEGKWNWFCLDNIRYHGKSLSIIWDRDGKKYNKGKGLSVWVDGKKVAKSRTLKKITGRLK